MAGKSRLDLTRIRELHSNGLHPSDIAKELDVHQCTVITQLKNMGLTWKKKKGGKPRGLTDEQEGILIQKYKEGVGATTLAKDYSVDKKTVYNILNKRGVGTRSVASRRKPKNPNKKHRISTRDLQISKLYDEGLSLLDIAAKLEIHEDTVRYSLRKQDKLKSDEGEMCVRQRIRTNKGLGKGNREVPKDPDVRHDAFNVLDEHSLYWMGFLLADGCIYQGAYGQPSICLNLKEGDIGHMEKLKEWIGTRNKISIKRPVTFGKERKICSLFWRSSKQAATLKEYGIVPHKESRFVNPFISSSMAFWRGLVDGDGCVYLPDEGTAYLSGQPPIIEEWTKFCEDLCGEKDVIRTYHRESVSIGSIRRKVHCKLILGKLYEDSNIHLDRKYEKATAWRRYQ